MKKPLSALFAVVAVIFVAVAIYYWVTPAGSLPHFVPGYEAHSNHKHMKHGLAALILAVGSAILAWFALGKKDTPSTTGSGSSPSAPTM